MDDLNGRSNKVSGEITWDAQVLWKKSSHSYDERKERYPIAAEYVDGEEVLRGYGHYVDVGHIGRGNLGNNIDVLCGRVQDLCRCEER
jgi:hypothetical protein